MAEQREIKSPEQLKEIRLEEIFSLLSQGKKHDEVDEALREKGLDKVAPPLSKEEAL